MFIVLHRRRRPQPAFVFAALMVFSGCSGSTDLRQGYACPFFEIATRLVSPVNDATNVPLTTTSIVVGPLTDGAYSIAISGGTTSQILLPGATTSSGLTLPLPPLAAHTLYILSYRPPVSHARCGNGEASGSFGQFMTQ